MLFLPEDVYNRRQQLLSEFESDKLTAETIYAAVLELNPNDFVGLVGMGKVRREAGDFADAEQYFWRAIQANPCLADPYVELARMLQSNPESHSLAMGLCELAILKKSREEDDYFLSGMEQAGLDGEALEAFRELPRAVRGRLIATTIGQNRADEPEAVSERLRPLRRIEQLQADELDTETIDAIMAEGPAMVPFLTGVLRAWAQDFLDEEEGDFALENALALLGETGSPAEIPYLMELIDLENTTAAGASDWALQRIVARHPVESARFVQSILPELAMTARLKIAEQTLHYPEFDPDGKLLEALGGNLASWEKKDRDVYFPLLLLTMTLAHGREGLKLARAALRRQGSLLSGNARRRCEELFADCDAGEIPRSPAKPSSLTVYDICSGEASWDDYEDDPDEIPDEREDEFLPAPEPVRRKVTPGRNDPCWCNSGKKYKKCHLESDERENRQMPDEGKAFPRDENEFVALRKNIGEFLGQVLPRREMEQSLAEFAVADESQPDNILLIDWMIHDRISPTLGKTVLEEYLLRRQRLTPREREMVEAWSRSHIGLYEVQQLKAGAGIQLKDLIFGDTFFAHDVSMSTRLSKWDGLLARVVPGERGTELAGAALTVPRMHLALFREWLDEDREESGLEWRQYLKGNWPRIRSRSFEIASHWKESLQLANTDGDELLFSKATYSVRDEAALIGAFQLAAHLTDDSAENETGARFVWLNDEKTVLGTIRVGNGELELETNSKARLDRGKRLISGLAGDSIRHLRDVFTSTKDLKRQGKESPTHTHPHRQSDIPKAVADEIVQQALDQHYAKWLEMKLPALDGKTPRQAVRTAKGREQLVELLKIIENGEEQKRQSGEPFYDVARLRSELGLNS